MQPDSLIATATALLAPSKGLLAADESGGTIAKRFADIHLESTPEHRRAYRELLCTAPRLEHFISGVILFDETIRQDASDHRPLPQLLMQRGIIPGIKVDAGTVPLAGFAPEKVTEGLDGLRQRLDDYRRLGARFAKWRAVISIAEGQPSEACLAANAHGLARYAAICQDAGLVPIVEPEVLMDGAHELERCATVTTRTLECVFTQLRIHAVLLEGMILKCNMVTAGTHAPRQATVDEVADRTLTVLRRCVPAAVPGIAFLSGGQSPELATQHLDAINRRGRQPWTITFSYGRALQEPVLQAWQGDPARWQQAQQQLTRRAHLNAAASHGAYLPAMEVEPVAV